jgi:hypothetical protein
MIMSNAASISSYKTKILNDLRSLCPLSGKTQGNPA